MMWKTRGRGRRCRGAKLAVAIVAALLVSHQAAGIAAAGFACTPSGAGIFPKKRIHIRCSNPQSGISYFALSSKSKEAASMSAMFTTAVAQGRTVDISYDPADLSGVKIGCGNADCRLLQWAEMH
jgi:hypothetical protein